MNKQIKDYTEVELKAFAYENMVQIGKLQNGLDAIKAELASRAKPAEEVKENKKK